MIQSVSDPASTMETLKTTALILGIIGGVLALLKVAFHSGEISKSVEGLRGEVKKHDDTLSAFTGEIRTCLIQHTERIAKVETQIENWDGRERRRQERGGI